jgi:predicted nucleic acid-binding protein
MHVFIDTNILLNFFHYSKDELDALNNVFASHKHGSATVYLTEQVCNEFKRNRESKIKDALKRFKDSRFTPQFPSFMKGYEEYGEIRHLSGQLQELQKTILEKVDKDISEETLLADRLIGEIFGKQKVVAVTEPIYQTAFMRLSLGNPPGKNNSLGDAVNWTILLESVPDNEDLHIISEDGDFYSALDEGRVHPFLLDEWKRTKGAALFAYRTLSAFMEEHFDGVAFAFDKDKEALIEALRTAGAFAVTHSLIAKLENYQYFSAKEVARILDAAEENNQFGWIVTDYDVSDFLNRVAVPHMGSLSEAHKAILTKAINEKKERVDA